MKSPISANSIMLSNLFSISALVKPSIIPFKKTFSIPVYSGLNPAPSSNKAEIFPLTEIAPPLWTTTPVIIFNNVDFPDPFFPIKPRISPLLTSKDTSLSA
ncbi:hypothetical protein D3C73_1095340 [compost metagenome]